MRIAIIGTGFTGLTAGYYLSKRAHQVTIFEKEKFCGGLAGGFKPASPAGGEKNWDWHLENFFHHLFVSDQSAKKLISKLGLSEKLFYTRPKTSIFYQGKISKFDSPFSVLTFPHLSFLEKLRTGLVTAYLKLKTPRMVAGWSEAETMTPPGWKGWKFKNITAEEWLKKYYGEKPYQILWQPLLKGKFTQSASRRISMSWFWARIKKRSSRLGYLEGGFQILIDKLVEKIKQNRGQIFLNHEVVRITSDGGRLSLRSHDSSEVNGFDKIIITTSVEKFLDIRLPNMLGAINLILILKEKFLADDTYWLNINQPGFPFVAVVEHTNFVDKKHYGGNHLVYVGGYYPQNHPFFKMTKEEIFKEFSPYLKQINPKFNILNTRYLILNTNLYAQPIIPVNYSKLIPSFKTQIPNVFLANMQMIYPWDRGINYAIELGKKVADEVSKTS